MKTKVKFFVLFLITFGLFVTTCKKEDEDTTPIVQIESIEFSKAKYEVNELEKIRLAKYLTILPSEVGDTVTIQWTSKNTDIATVNSSGAVTGVKVGTTEITATALGKSATCEVKVTEIAIKDFSLPESIDDLSVNTTKNLDLTITPSNANPSNITWTYDKTKLKVQFDGSNVSVTPLQPGTATLVGKVGEIERTCTITAVYTKVEAITVSPESVSLVVGDTKALSKTITPSTASYQDVTWSTSDAKVATVSASGLVKAVGEGKCTITVQTDYDKLSASCVVSVSKTPLITSFSLDKTSLDLNIGEQATITATNITPATAVASSIIWSSSDEELATVDQNGVVTATSENNTGTVTIKASSNGVEKTCNVTIKKVAVTSLTVSHDTIYMLAKYPCSLTTKVSPSNATFPAVTYTSSSSDVYMSNGNVCASSDAAGHYYLTANADGVTKRVEVYVFPAQAYQLQLNDKSNSYYGTFGMKVITEDILTHYWNKALYGTPKRELVTTSINQINGTSVKIVNNRLWYTKTNKISDVSDITVSTVFFTIRCYTTNNYYLDRDQSIAIYNSFLGISGSGCRTSASSCAENEGSTFTVLKTASGTSANMWYYEDQSGDYTDYYSEHVSFSGGVPSSATVYNLCSDAASALSTTSRTIKYKAGSETE